MVGSGCDLLTIRFSPKHLDLSRSRWCSWGWRTPSSLRAHVFPGSYAFSSSQYHENSSTFLIYRTVCLLIASVAVLLASRGNRITFHISNLKGGIVHLRLWFWGFEPWWLTQVLWPCSRSSTWWWLEHAGGQRCSSLGDQDAEREVTRS